MVYLVTYLQAGLYCLVQGTAPIYSTLLLYTVQYSSYSAYSAKRLSTTHTHRQANVHYSCSSYPDNCALHTRGGFPTIFQDFFYDSHEGIEPKLFLVPYFHPRAFLC